jgi:hypothetical protein
MMGLPVLGDQIDLDVARAWFVLAELEDSGAEIRAWLVIPEAGMEHSQRLAIEGAEVLAAQALVVPDALEQALRRMGGIALAQEVFGLLLRAPLSVKIRAGCAHVQSFSGRQRPKSRSKLIALAAIFEGVWEKITMRLNWMGERLKMGAG